VRSPFVAAMVAMLCTVSCGREKPAPIAVHPGRSAPRPRRHRSLPTSPIWLTAESVATRIQTREHMIAAVEMQLSGEPLADAMRPSVLGLGAASHATSGFVHSEAHPGNPLGWLGLWPVLHPFASFDPAVHATNSVSMRCVITSDDDGPGDADRNRADAGPSV